MVDKAVIFRSSVHNATFFKAPRLTSLLLIFEYRYVLFSFI
jgi:hypothetical protein